MPNIHRYAGRRLGRYAGLVGKSVASDLSVPDVQDITPETTVTATPTAIISKAPAGIRLYVRPAQLKGI